MCIRDSSGIGRSIALGFAAAGCHVVLHGRKPSEQLDAVEKELFDAHPSGMACRVEKIFADFSEPTDWPQLVDQVWRKIGPVDYWVNNAGGDVLTDQWADRSIEEKLDYLWKTDVTASLMLSRLVGRRMIEDRNAASCGEGNGLGAVAGSIVNIGWDQADQLSLIHI